MPELTEGAARLLLPDWAGGLGPEKGPGSSRMPVFYNPAMRLGRDLCVLAVGRMGLSRPLRAVDGLAGSGVRAIRLALETGARFERLVANDRSPEAFGIIKENLRQNGLEGKVEPASSDLGALLSSERFDYIDVDPFGSPVEFVLAASRAIRHRGVMGMTSTDTGPLCGTNPSTCLRRYGAVSMRSEHMHETAARILVGYCVRQAASLDIGLWPLLAHGSEHYVRVYLRAERGIRQAEEALGRLGYLASGRRTLGLEEGSPVKGRVTGPLWLGPLFDRPFLDGMQKDAGERLTGRALGPAPPAPLAAGERLWRLLELMREEAQMPPFFHELDACASEWGTDPPPLKALLEALRAAGFRASRTHFCPTGFRTDAPADELERLFKSVPG